MPYLEDAKKILTKKPPKKPPSDIKNEDKSGKSVLSDSKPPSTAKEDWVQKLLATSALHRQFKISGQIGEPEQKYKISFSSLARQIQMGLSQGYDESEIVDGVIRLITPGMVLRSYLETYKELTLDRLKKFSVATMGKEYIRTLSSTSILMSESKGITPGILNECS